MAFLLPYLLFSFLFILPISSINFTINSFLTATDNSSWLSPSGYFAFGFHKLEPTTDDLFLLSIWYAKIPEKTVVWSANGDTPAPRGSKLNLTSDRGLVLTNPQGDLIWSSSNQSSVNGVDVSQGVMYDTGNFVLEDRGFNKLWESFKNPTDTLLPSQVIEKEGFLSSKLSNTDFSKGRFQLRMLADGNLVLNTINLPTNYANEAYYISGTYSPLNTSRSGIRMVFDLSGYMYILRQDGEIFNLTNGMTERISEKDFYFRATLDFDGVFTQYYYPKTANSGSGWTKIWFIPDQNICKINLVAGSGVCGYNSVCTVTDDNRPSCSCPIGYDLLDPNDRYGTCKPNFIQNCEKEELDPDLYTFNVILNTDWPLSDYVLLKPSTEELCRTSCLQDCMCAVAIFRDVDSCWKKRLPLSNGRVDQTLNSKAFMKIRKDNSTTLGPRLLKIPEKQKIDTIFVVLGSLLLGGSVFINIIFIAAIFLGFFSISRRKRRTIFRSDKSFVGSNIRCFTYEELLEATNGFKEELGRGAFGVVYKGEIQVDFNVIPIAVKKLSNVLLQDPKKEFETEVNVIGQTHHKNLVRLLGFCDEKENRLLVYEFLSNGTLASCLFGEVKPSWSQRTQMALGIARGLLYLHEECSNQIIHCDIKPQNILLDDYYNVKISDFGLAKLLMLNQSKTHTAVRGTRGYVALEWFRNMPITTKVDVYSFGVMLLEIVCCRRSVDMELGRDDRAILSEWAYDCYIEGCIEDLVENDRDALDDKKKFEMFVKVAIWCIQEDPSIRPSMRNVIQMLEAVVEVLDPPSPCPFTVTT